MHIPILNASSYPAPERLAPLLGKLGSATRSTILGLGWSLLCRHILCTYIYMCIYIYRHDTHISICLFTHLPNPSIYLPIYYLSIYRRIYPLPSGLIHGKPRETLVQPGFGQLVGATFNLNCATHCKGRLLQMSGMPR